MIEGLHPWYQGIILVVASLIFSSACAIDNPDTPNLISKFNFNEKIYLKAIKNPANGTRDTIRTYYEYNKFLDRNLIKHIAV